MIQTFSEYIFQNLEVKVRDSEHEKKTILEKVRDFRT